MAERLIISIDLDGASLQDDYVYEVEKILKFTAKRLGLGSQAGFCQDTNGNTVGHYRIEKQGI